MKIDLKWVRNGQEYFKMDFGFIKNSQNPSLGIKTEILEGWEIPKFSFEAQEGVLRVFINPKLILNISWTIPESF